MITKPLSISTNYDSDYKWGRPYLALLIGVDDNASIKGLDKDYETLKKADRDGFEQYIMQSVSLYLGTENCKNLQILFVTSNDKDVCIIKVSSIKTPIFLKHQ